MTATGDVIKHPHVTEKSMDSMDFENKLQFVVDVDATKDEVKEAIEERYDVRIEKVNTMVTASGTKKAIVRFTEEGAAEDVASRIGVF